MTTSQPLTIPAIFGRIYDCVLVMREADLIHSIFLAVYRLDKPVNSNKQKRL